MIPDEQVTAELRISHFQDFPDGQIAWDYVFNDKKNRFRNGERIHTSLILEQTDEYITTLNSIYKVIP